MGLTAEIIWGQVLRRTATGEVHRSPWPQVLGPVSGRCTPAWAPAHGAKPLSDPALLSGSLTPEGHDSAFTLHFQMVAPVSLVLRYTESLHWGF